MEWSQDNWGIVAGVALFLLAIRSMEGAISEMSGRKFKLFLKRETGNRAKAAATGTLIAAILQSSSVVNLVIMDMTGSGILTLQSALSLTLGANIGTTVNSWLVALLGFNVDMKAWILPLTGITGIAIHLSGRWPRLLTVLRLLFAVSLMLFSLDFIKSGMGSLLTHSSLQTFSSPVAFAFFALAATAFVQASSIIMVLALSALYVGSIPFEAACALVVGGEIGTTLKLFFAARGSNETRKAMAWGNFLINLGTASIVLLVLSPLCRMVLSITGSGNGLVGLVLFQTFFNLLSLLIFLPWLPKVSRWLTRLVHGKSSLQDVAAITNDADALATMESAVQRFLNQVACYMAAAFGSRPQQLMTEAVKGFDDKPVEQQYTSIKQLHGQLHSLLLGMNRGNGNVAVNTRIDQLASSLRNAMYAAKSIRNINEDIRQFRNSSNDIKYDFFTRAADRVPAFCDPLLLLLNHRAPTETDYSSRLDGLYSNLTNDYKAAIASLYTEPMVNGVSDMEFSSLLNCNREMFSAFKSFFYGTTEWLLTPADAAVFAGLPGFIK